MVTAQYLLYPTMPQHASSCQGKEESRTSSENREDPWMSFHVTSYRKRCCYRKKDFCTCLKRAFRVLSLIAFFPWQLKSMNDTVSHIWPQPPFPELSGETELVKGPPQICVLFSSPLPLMVISPAQGTDVFHTIGEKDLCGVKQEKCPWTLLLVEEWIKGGNFKHLLKAT